MGQVAEEGLGGGRGERDEAGEEAAGEAEGEVEQGLLPRVGGGRNGDGHGGAGGLLLRAIR